MTRGTWSTPPPPPATHPPRRSAHIVSQQRRLPKKKKKKKSRAYGERETVQLALDERPHRELARRPRLSDNTEKGGKIVREGKRQGAAVEGRHGAGAGAEGKVGAWMNTAGETVRRTGTIWTISQVARATPRDWRSKNDVRPVATPPSVRRIGRANADTASAQTVRTHTHTHTSQPRMRGSQPRQRRSRDLATPQSRNPTTPHPGNPA